MTKKKKERLRAISKVGKYTISSADLAKQEQKRKGAESLTPKEKDNEANIIHLMISSSQLGKKRRERGRKVT